MNPTLRLYEPEASKLLMSGELDPPNLYAACLALRPGWRSKELKPIEERSDRSGPMLSAEGLP